METLFKRNWTKLVTRVSQGVIDDPAAEGTKALSKLKGVNLAQIASSVIKPDSNKSQSKWLIHPDSSYKLA